MQAEFRLPALGADMDAGTVVEWRVAPGDRCKRGDVVAVVETDKGAIDVEIFIDGVVREIAGAAGHPRSGRYGARAARHRGACSRVGAALPVPPPQPVAAARSASRSRHVEQRVKISPAARKRAQELHVDVASLRGTGPEGAITVAGRRASRAVTPAPRPLPRERAAAGMRAAIAAAMSRSKREIPHYYLATTVDVTPRRRLARGPQRRGAGDASGCCCRCCW